MEKDANHPVKTTEKSLQIIEKIQELDGARIHELESVLDMTKGAIHNHLSTLRKHGYVYQDDNEYRLSLQFLTIGGHVRNNIDLYRKGRSKAIQLAEDTGMLVNLLTEENGRGVYLYQARGNYAVNLDTHVGYRIRLHNIAVGKAILANLSRERVEEILDQWGLPEVTENTITDRSVLLEELAEIEQRGYAIDHEERTEGLACIGAPVCIDDDVLGAISISAPTGRLGDGNFDSEIISNVVSAANELELSLKYQ